MLGNTLGTNSFNKLGIHLIGCRLDHIHHGSPTFGQANFQAPTILDVYGAI